VSAKKKVNSPVGRRLKSARTEIGLSQKQLGIRAEIDEFSASPRINQYEKDKHVPDYSTAQRLAKALSIPVTYLYADDDELAEFILLFSAADKRLKKQVIDSLK
jgi:transcriptional regulator with XRE-family HTH domain